MKAKVGRGSGFRGVLEYALDHDDARIVGGTMSGLNARELANEFGAVRALRPEVERPVWHTSLAAAPGETLSDEQWKAVAEGFMRKMGFPEPTPFVVVRHASGEEQKTAIGKGPTTEHVHIIASRIDLSGELWLGQWEAKTAINATQELEREHGLVQTKGLGPRAAVKQASKPEVDMAARLSAEAGHEVKPARVQLQEKVAGAIAGGATVREFVDRLHAEGVNVRPNLASTGTMNGFSFELDGIAMKGSDLGKAFTFSSLKKAGLDYDKARDTAFLASLTTKPLNEPRAPAPAPIITKETEHGRTGLHRRGDRDLDTAGDFGKPGQRSAGRSAGADAERGHRARTGLEHVPAGAVAVLERRMQHMSASDLGARWGHASSALRADVPRHVGLVGAGHGDRGLLGTRGRAPAAAVAYLPATGRKGFRPVPSFWSKKKKGFTKAQTKQLEIIADRLAHMLVKLVCRMFGVDYVTPHEQQQLEQQQRRARVADLPPKAPPAPAATPAPRPVARPIDPERARRAELAKAAIGKAPPAPVKSVAPAAMPTPAAGRPIKPADPRDALEERRREDAKRVVAKALATGKGATAALSSAASHGSLEDVEKLLATGKADPSANPKALTEAGKKDPAMLRAMVQQMISAGTVKDHAELSTLASQLGPEAASQIRQIASDAKAGGSLSSAGFKEPETPGGSPKTPGMSSGPSMNMGGPKGGGGR